MDNRRFDDLARLLGRGASRRSILKGLLGLGSIVGTGTAMSDNAESRSLGSRPSLPLPPPPEPTTSTTPAPTTSTASPCTGFRCGFDCCDDQLQCCDGECCPGGTVCLTLVFSEGPFVEEEVCCAAEQTCDEQCCDGACFTQLGTTATEFTRACCPAEGTLCPGTGSFAGVALCCSGETSDCCTNPDGSPICLATVQCCTAAECTALTSPARCLEGVCRDFTCHADTVCAEGERCCPGEEVGFCFSPEDGQCCTNNDCAGECGSCQNGTCFVDPSKCSGCKICAVVDGGQYLCIDSDDECSGNPDGSSCCNGACAECCDNGDCSGCAICAFTAEGPMCFDSDDECSGNPAGSACCNGACRVSCQTTACSDTSPCPGTDCHVCIEGTCQDDSSRCLGNCSRCLGGTCFAAPANCTGCQVCSFNPQENTGTCIDWDPLCPAGESCVKGMCGIPCDDDLLCPGECHTCIEGFCEIDQDKCFGDCGFCAITGVCVANAQFCTGECQVCLFNPETNTGTCTNRDESCPTGQICVDGACGVSCSEQTPCSGECHTCANGLCQIDQEKCFGDCGFCANTGVCVANAQLCAGACQVCLFNPDTNTGACTDRDESCPDGQSCINGVCLTGCNEANPCPGECHTCVTGFCEVDQEKCFGDCGFCASTGVCVANAAACTGCQVCSFNPGTNTGTCTDFDNLCDSIDACTPAQCVNAVCAEQSSCFPDAPCNEITGSCESTSVITAVECTPDCTSRICGSDGCTGSCGECTDFVNSFCDDGVCGCQAATCASLGIGCGQWLNDGCGNDVYCGDCPVIEESLTTPATESACLAEGKRCVNDNQCCDGLCRGRDCGDRGRKICTTACST